MALPTKRNFKHSQILFTNFASLPCGTCGRNQEAADPILTTNAPQWEKSWLLFWTGGVLPITEYLIDTDRSDPFGHVMIPPKAVTVNKYQILFVFFTEYQVDCPGTVMAV